MQIKQFCCEKLPKSGREKLQTFQNDQLYVDELCCCSKITAGTLSYLVGGALMACGLLKSMADHASKEEETDLCNDLLGHAQ